ncbi:MAG: hypothetical protein ACFFCJ_03775 [Promethearchaeota archaeon]
METVIIAQNVRSFYKGQFIFLGGVGLSLVGSTVVLILPAIYYIAALVGLGLSLYGAYLVIFPGVMTGTDFAAAKLALAAGVFLMVGFGLYFIPFVFGWPIFTGHSIFFGPSLTLLYNGLLLIGLCTMAILLLLPDVYRQWQRITLKGEAKKIGGIRSYSAIVAIHEEDKKENE